jgi:hypothetical protein
MKIQLRTADITSAFSSLPWHDSEFLGWSVLDGDDGRSNVTFDINFNSTELVTGRAEVKLHDCRGFYTDVDLVAKRLCSNQIATGYSEHAEESDAAFVKDLTDRFDLHPDESMDGLFVFGIKLIHPGGELVVIARSFSLWQSTL